MEELYILVPMNMNRSYQDAKPIFNLEKETSEPETESHMDSGHEARCAGCSRFAASCCVAGVLQSAREPATGQDERRQCVVFAHVANLLLMVHPGVQCSPSADGPGFYAAVRRSLHLRAHSKTVHSIPRAIASPCSSRARLGALAWSGCDCVARAFRRSAKAQLRRCARACPGLLCHGIFAQGHEWSLQESRDGALRYTHAGFVRAVLWRVKQAVRQAVALAHTALQDARHALFALLTECSFPGDLQVPTRIKHTFQLAYRKWPWREPVRLFLLVVFCKKAHCPLARRG
jgi:hypothetical protein